jgi:hypothetical protein
MGLKQSLIGLVEPDDASWGDAPPSLRRAYYDQAGKVALKQLRKQLSRAIGANGRQMKARIRPVLPDGSDGPVMEPHYDMSRVISLMDYAATDRALTIFWHAGTGHRSHRVARKKGAKAPAFGTILEYHAKGEVPHAPVRDVRMSKANARQVKLAMKAWWTSHKPREERRPRKKVTEATEATKATTPTQPKGTVLGDLSGAKGRGPHWVESKAFRSHLPPKKPPEVQGPPKAPEGPKFDAAAERAKQALAKAEAARAKEEARKAAEAALAKAREEAEARAREEAEARAREEAEARAREEAEAARLAAEARAREEAGRKARLAREQAEKSAEAARKKAEAEAKHAADLARLEAKRLAKEEAEAAARADALAKAQAKAKAKAVAPGPKAAHGPVPAVTREEVLDVLKGLPESAKPSEKNAALYGFVRERLGPKTPRAAHGMSFEEDFHALRFEGVTYHFTFPEGEAPAQGPAPAILPQLRGLAAMAPIPREIARHTSDVFLSSQVNSADDYWRVAYNNPNHVSGATGGDGRVVAYGGGTANGGMLVHEMGHNLADAVFRSTAPTPGSDYDRAMRSAEQPSSEYAKNSPAEDFAEAVKEYWQQPDVMKTFRPLRFKAVDELVRRPGGQA